MIKRTLKMLMIGSLVASFGVACGDEADPSKPSGNNDNNTVNNTNNTTNNTTDPNNTTNNTTDPNNTTNNTTDPNNTTNNTSNNGTNNTPVECTLISDFYGQIGGSGDNDGGAPDLDGTLDFDAGLQAVLDAIPAAPDDEDTMDVDEGRADGLTLAVTGALVTGTVGGNYANNSFWIQDQNVAMRVRLDNGATQTAVIKVGQKISFTVTSVNNYAGIAQIALIDGDAVTIDSEGNAVPYTEETGNDVTIDMFERNVRIWGTLTTDGAACGGTSKCYDLSHGDKVINLRSSSSFIQKGDCITFAGPLGAFPGPIGAGGTPELQLETGNFNWTFTKK